MKNQQIFSPYRTSPGGFNLKNTDYSFLSRCREPKEKVVLWNGTSFLYNQNLKREQHKPEEEMTPNLKREWH